MPDLIYLQMETITSCNQYAPGTGAYMILPNERLFNPNRKTEVRYPYAGENYVSDNRHNHVEIQRKRRE
jgi:hypothetical protein